MKKKIVLLPLLTLLFVCLFAVGVSAAGFTSDYTTVVTKFYAEDNTTELLPTWDNLSDRSATAVIKKENGTDIRIPLYYIYYQKGTTFYDDVRSETSTSAGFKYDWISAQLGETISHTNLVALDIPEGITSVNTINNCKSLTEVNFPLTATGFPKSENHPTLKKVYAKQQQNADGTISGITTISNYAFKNAKALEYFKLELDYTTSIGDNSFLNTAVKELRLEGPMTKMGGMPFAGCTSLTTVYINNTSDTIVSGSQIFSGASNLTNATLNGIGLTDYTFQTTNALTNGGLTVVATNVGAMGQMVFKNSTNVTSVTITGATSIGNSFFLNCTNLKTVDISGPITSVGSSIFSGSSNVESIKIVNTLDTPVACSNNMCDGFKKLTYVEMHGISVSGYAFRQAGDPTTGMVVKCTNAGLIGEGAFYKANATEIYVSGPLTSIVNSTYRECPLLKKLTVINTGDTVVTGGNGESNPVLETLHLEGKMKISGSPAFQNNTALKHVYVGTGVEELVDYCFYKCYALETMYLADTVSKINDRAIDMDAAGKQTSTSFMFVDENGNMDNTLPTSLTYIGGHFLKHFTIANTELIFPEGFTSHTSNQAYDFEGMYYPEGFRLVYLGKMTALNLQLFSKHNASKDITVYLTQNSASDIKNHRVEAIFDGSTIKHGAYAGKNENGTLEIIVDNSLQNNINPTDYMKFYFCQTDEICFVTRVNIVWDTNTSSSWGNFVSTPVTYAQLETAYKTYNDANEIDKVLPAKHIHDASKDVTSEATCTLPAGSFTFCYCGSIITQEIVEESVALGHIKGEITIYYPVVNGAPNYFANAHHSYICGRAGCEIDEEIKDTALFTEKGYSKEEGGNSFTYGISLNKAAEKAYIENGNAISYGFIIGSINGSNGNVINADGTSNLEAYILTDFAKSEYDRFSIYNVKMFGLSDIQKSQDIYCCAYVIDNSNVYYAGETVTTTASTISYDKINPSKDDE